MGLLSYHVCSANIPNKPSRPTSVDPGEAPSSAASRTCPYWLGPCSSRPTTSSSRGSICCLAISHTHTLYQISTRILQLVRHDLPHLILQGLPVILLIVDSADLKCIHTHINTSRNIWFFFSWMRLVKNSFLCIMVCWYVLLRFAELRGGHLVVLGHLAEFVGLLDRRVHLLHELVQEGDVESDVDITHTFLGEVG